LNAVATRAAYHRNGWWKCRCGTSSLDVRKGQRLAAGVRCLHMEAPPDGPEPLDFMFPEEAEGLQVQPPASLYHYTNVAGLEGIMRERKIRATHCSYLNDANELNYGYELLSGAVHALLEGKAFRSQWEEKFLQLCIVSMHPERRAIEPFIACFCERSDVLSQWRGYGGDGGYALEFDTGPLVERNLSFRQVVYQPGEQQLILRAMLIGALSRLRDMKDMDKKKLGHCLAYFSSALWTSLAVFKDLAFHEEQEWRMIYGYKWRENETFRVPLHFRPGRTLLIPYLEVDISVEKGKFEGKLPLNGITIGPNVDGRLAEKSIRLFTELAGYSALLPINQARAVLRPRL
jgi:hypothetical protein